MYKFTKLFLNINLSIFLKRVIPNEAIKKVPQLN